MIATAAGGMVFIANSGFLGVEQATNSSTPGRLTSFDSGRCLMDVGVDHCRKSQTCVEEIILMVILLRSS